MRHVQCLPAPSRVLDEVLLPSRVVGDGWALTRCSVNYEAFSSNFQQTWSHSKTWIVNWCNERRVRRVWDTTILRYRRRAHRRGCSSGEGRRHSMWRRNLWDRPSSDSRRRRDRIRVWRHIVDFEVFEQQSGCCEWSSQAPPLSHVVWNTRRNASEANGAKYRISHTIILQDSSILCCTSTIKSILNSRI